MHNKNEDYSLIYPEINERNVFSISTLAHSSGSQVYWKLNGKRENNYINLNMVMGKSLHEFIQKRMKSETTEYELQYITQDYIPSEKGFKLLGHIDIVDFKNKELTDIKTTSMIYCIDHNFYFSLHSKFAKEHLSHNLQLYGKLQEGRLREYILQVGTYAKLLEIETNSKFTASVIVVNGELTEYILSEEDIENSFNVILQRAQETYERLFIKPLVKV